MLTQEELELVAGETALPPVIVYMIALDLEETHAAFSLADLVGQVSLALESFRETSGRSFGEGRA